VTARAARVAGGPVQHRRQGGLLSAVSRWAAGGRAVADVDAPTTALDPGIAGLARYRRPHCHRASVAGIASTSAGGAGTSRLASRCGDQVATMARRPSVTRGG